LADYLSAHYCVVAPALGAAGSAFAALAWAAVLFHVMSIVASGFFIPALENIAAYLGLPEDVAGATLLAFGNGAPDVFAQIAAIRRADAEGVSLALASVLGGGLFVCAAVFPIATLVSPCEERGAASRAERRYSYAEGGADANEGIIDSGGIDSRRLLDAEAETSDASDDEDESGGASGAAGSAASRGAVISATDPGSNGLDPGSNGLDPGSIGERLFGPVGWFNRGGAELAPGALARDAGFYLVAVVAAFGPLAARKRTFDGLGAGALALAYGLYLAVLFLPPRVKTFVDARGEGEGGDEGFVEVDDDGGDDRGVDERAIESPSGATKNSTSRHRGALDAAGGSGDSVPAADARGDGGGARRGGGSGSGSGLLDDDESFDDAYAALLDPSRGPAASANARLRWGGGGAGSGSHGGVAERLADVSVDPERGEGGEAQARSERSAPWARSGKGVGASRGLLGLFAASVRAPARFLVRLTTPDLGADPRAGSSRWFASVLPVTAPLFFAYSQRFFPSASYVNVDGAAYGAACGALGAVAMYCAWPALTGPDAPRSSVRAMDATLTTLAFVVSVAWLDAAAGELVSLIAATGKITGANEDALGATVLAWGDGASDAVVNAVVASEGRVLMAASACFAGPAFNLLVGASVSFGLSSGAAGIPYAMPNELVVLFVALTAFLAYVAVAVPLAHESRVSRGAAFGFLGYYAVANAVYACVCAGVVAKTPWMAV
jgi:sodium/potassium/calcium exchanger 6